MSGENLTLCGGMAGVAAATGGPVGEITAERSDDNASYRPYKKPGKNKFRPVLSANTDRAYLGALRRFEIWRVRGRFGEDDRSRAAYLDHLGGLGHSAASGRMIVAAWRWSTGAAVGDRTGAAIARFRRLAAVGAVRRQMADPLSVSDVEALTAAAVIRRRTGCGYESRAAAEARALTDRAILALLFYAALRRSEVARVRCRDVRPSRLAGACLVSVATSKTNQHGDRADYRLIPGPAAESVQRLARDRPAADPLIGLQGAAISARVRRLAAAAGLVGRRITSHSGRIGLACELVKQGFSIAEIQLAGGWASPAMPAYYARSTVAEDGAVAQFFGGVDSAAVGRRGPARVVPFVSRAGRDDR